MGIPATNGNGADQPEVSLLLSFAEKESKPCIPFGYNNLTFGYICFLHIPELCIKQNAKR